MSKNSLGVCIIHTHTHVHVYMYRSLNYQEALFTNMVRRLMENALVPYSMKRRDFATIAGRHLGKTFR